MVLELERNKSEALGSFSSVNPSELPKLCDSWIKSKASSSSAFVQICSKDFRPKLAKQVDDLNLEHRDALNSLKAAANDLKEPSQKILNALNDLFHFFKGEASSIDPWLNELTVRHYSARFLDQKSIYLETLHKIYIQIRHLSSDLEHKFTDLADEFLRILERFHLAEGGDISDFSTEFQDQGYNDLSMWQTILKNYSLDYDWKLQCPPLDGFLSTLYTYLKSLGANLSSPITANSHNGLPQIFPETCLKFGFLQKSVSGLISRSWQAFFAILQPVTGYLHLYKVNTIKSVEGNLLVPSPGSPYTKAALHDLNLLASQFFLASTHQPAAISPQSLTPHISIHVTGCKAVASDPSNFTFSIKTTSTSGGGSNGKINLRAFCEEEFVNWVIFLNEQITNKPKEISNDFDLDSKSSSSLESSEESQSQNFDHIPALDTSQFSSKSEIISNSTPIVDLENPWN